MFGATFFFAGNSFAKGLLTIAGVGFLAGGALTIGRPGFWLGHCGGFLVLLWCFFGHKDQVWGELQGIFLTEEFLVNSAKFFCEFLFIKTMRGVVCKEMLQLQAIVIYTLEVQPPFLFWLAYEAPFFSRRGQNHHRTGTNIFIII